METSSQLYKYARIGEEELMKRRGFSYSEKQSKETKRKRKGACDASWGNASSSLREKHINGGERGREHLKGGQTSHHCFKYVIIIMQSFFCPLFLSFYYFMLFLSN